jgi:hypothetical protein
MDQNLYEEDENLWREQMVELLEKGKLNEIDAINLKVMLIEMGKSDKRSVLSNLEEIIFHILKAKYHSDLDAGNCLISIIKHRRYLKRIFEDAKSLEDYAKTKFKECYQQSRKFVLIETGLRKYDIPEIPPFDFEYAISEELPESVQKFRTDF